MKTHSCPLFCERRKLCDVLMSATATTQISFHAAKRNPRHDSASQPQVQYLAAQQKTNPQFWINPRRKTIQQSPPPLTSSFQLMMTFLKGRTTPAVHNAPIRRNDECWELNCHCNQGKGLKCRFSGLSTFNSYQSEWVFFDDMSKRQTEQSI